MSLQELWLFKLIYCPSHHRVAQACHVLPIGESAICFRYTLIFISVYAGMISRPCNQPQPYADMHTSDRTRVRIWDLPTRIFHWLLVLVIAGAVITAKIGGDAMGWHFLFGYSIFALLVFRLLWGVLGGHWSRFGRFIYGPGTMLRYVRGKSHESGYLDVGHNPLGSLSVFALLGFLGVQVASGLVADDEIVNVGPLNKFVSADLAGQATSWHTTVGQYALYGLIALHIAAVIYYVVRKRNNVLGPMFTGDKILPSTTPPSSDGPAQRALAALLLGVCVGIVAWVVKLGA
jgi:cytochrome b